ncbi:hypothetical protein [uncultured Duncaniella sp.]|nr:hypothetical protein [uncultured Duncaniella sp.]
MNQIAHFVEIPTEITLRQAFDGIGTDDKGNAYQDDFHKDEA